MIAGIVYAAKKRADVINLSLGGAIVKRDDRGFWLPMLIRATSYAHGQGSMVVTSAGNSAENLNRIDDGFREYCTNPNVVCVSGTEPRSSAGVNGPWEDIAAPAPYTNYGRSAIDVAAPGAGGTSRSVWAACSSFNLFQTLACQNNTTLSLGLDGTSMAARHVSGVAAILIQRYGKGNRPGAGSSSLRPPTTSASRERIPSTERVG